MTCDDGDPMDLELSPFDEAADVLRGMMPVEFGEPRCRSNRYGLKLWFGPAKPTREHYEAQVIGADEVEGASVLAIEIGFHSEYPQPPENDAVLAHLATSERTWRRTLGAEPEAGAFLGRQSGWRRVSETWPDPDLGDPELGFELAARLIDYVTALEPARRMRATK